jgi:hypothetical protein
VRCEIDRIVGAMIGIKGDSHVDSGNGSVGLTPGTSHTLLKPGYQCLSQKDSSPRWMPRC